MWNFLSRIGAGTVGFFKTAGGTVLTVLGVGTAAEVATRETDENGNVVKPGVVTEKIVPQVGDIAKSVTQQSGATQQAHEAGAHAVNLRDDAANVLFTAQGEASKLDATQQAHEKQLRLDAESALLQGRISKANFWTGTFGSILVDLVNSFAPGSWLADKLNSYVEEGTNLKNSLSKEIKKDGTVLVTGDQNMPETAAVARTEYRAPEDRGTEYTSMGPTGAPVEKAGAKLRATGEEMTSPPPPKANIKEENMSFRPTLEVAPS